MSVVLEEELPNQPPTPTKQDIVIIRNSLGLKLEVTEEHLESIKEEQQQLNLPYSLEHIVPWQDVNTSHFKSN